LRGLIALCGVMAALIVIIGLEIAIPGPGDEFAGPADGQPSRARSQPGAGKASANGSDPNGSGVETLSDIAARITARPLFSPARRALDTPAGAVADTSRGGLPRLTGVIVGPGGGRAIFAGADGRPRTAAEGDTIGVFKVRKIDPGVVILSGPEGERVLRPVYINPGRMPGDANSRMPPNAKLTVPGPAPIGLASRGRTTEGIRTTEGTK
jgi:hypothetical protein